MHLDLAAARHVEVRVGLGELVELVGPEPVDLCLQPTQPGRQNSVDALATELLRVHEPGIGQDEQVL
ncbi:hypothetical protein [Terrabacter sp. MAHUQ-38]|uniref:hypothetical protein n=1 Tax=unclassified Terrabacter TaxID=2630222 RepID=UPI002102A139|nr:hypothetical protein [Terrabacter sp. MAHUQ-38]